MRVQLSSRPTWVRALTAATVAALSTVGVAVAATPAVAATLALAGPAQGPIPQTGCTLGTGTATCELYAKTGTWTLPGVASVPIWGFASTATDAATLPGPVLVVNQGDAVTVNLHNGLSQNVSLAFPSVTGLGDDPAGVATGGVKTYTFTATRPGTYLYEAGHTVDGARQTAMGLHGALVVRSSTAGTAYGSAATGFQDEQVLVLSEVDTAFNANPTGYDLRKYHPQYRLINGKAYPEIPSVATDVGRTVLLRYVNAGLMSHAMGTLGVNQTLVGQDARPMSNPQIEVSETIPPGETLDSIVAIPASGDGAKFPLYETAGQLDNNGQNSGTSRIVGFGGMLTFLDTNATPATGDVLGPTSRNISVTPNPASVMQNLTVKADFSDVGRGGANVTDAEYVIDDLSVAEGTTPPGQHFSGTFGAPSVTGATATITSTQLTALSSGRHVVYVRARDANGNWGPIGSATFMLSTTGPTTTAAAATPNPTNGQVEVSLSATGDDSALGGTVTAAEYFVDTQGADGTGTAMDVPNPPVTVAAVVGKILATTMSALPEGHHTVYIHSQDSAGLWGEAATVDLVVDKSAPALSIGSVTPNPNNGTLGSARDPSSLEVDATFTDPVSATVNSHIVAAEGFIDNASGATGSGFVFFANDGQFNSTTEATYGLIPLSELTSLAQGNHAVYVHAEDAAGNWGPLTALSFVIDRTGPTTSGPTVSPNATSGSVNPGVISATASDTQSAIAQGEWFDGANPGLGAGNPMTVTSTGPTSATLTGSIPLSTLSAGNHVISVRAKDVAGNWGPTATVTINNAIFADGFESGNINAWNGGRTGPATGSQVTPQSSLTGTRGLAISGTTPSYLNDNTPAGERSYHASFQFRPNTLNPGAGNTITLLSARNLDSTVTTGNTNVVDVLYRINAGVRQVSVVVRTGATTTVASGWSNLPTNANTVSTIQVDWASATAATVTLRIGGAPVQTLTNQNTSGFTIQSARFGLVTSSGATTGTGHLDTFNSTRYHLP